MRHWIVLLVGLFLSTLTFAQPSATDEVFTIVEAMPRFPSASCDAPELSESERKTCAEKAMLEYVYSNISYPDSARAKGLEGMAVVSFIVEKDGQLSNPEIVRSVGGGCDEAVLDMLKGMPNWVPGKKDGQAVRVAFNLPVRFKLESIEDQLAQLNEVKEYEGMTAIFCAPFVGEFLPLSLIHEAAGTAINELDICGYQSKVIYLSIGRERNGERQDIVSEGPLTTEMADLFRTAQKDDALFVEFNINRGGLIGKIVKVIIVE
ncbi:MAG: energy transducer TonB [Bacteroidota bacterium]